MSGKKREGGGGGSFSFVNFTHPNQAKDSKAKKQIFSHAMRDHLRRQGSEKVRSAKGQWVSGTASKNVGTTSNTSVVKTVKRLKPGRAPVRHVSGRGHDQCACQLGPGFACLFEPNLNVVKSLPPLRRVGDVDDPLMTAVHSESFLSPTNPSNYVCMCDECVSLN